jgi:hypothetical protein
MGKHHVLRCRNSHMGILRGQLEKSDTSTPQRLSKFSSSSLFRRTPKAVSQSVRQRFRCRARRIAIAKRFRRWSSARPTTVDGASFGSTAVRQAGSASVSKNLIDPGDLDQVLRLSGIPTHCPVRLLIQGRLVQHDFAETAAGEEDGPTTRDVSKVRDS